MPSFSSSILFNRASFAWPDGTRVLDAASAAFGMGRTGLIGDNGAGKTTLLRLIAGQLSPTSGTVEVAGDVGYLRQRVTLDTDATVSDLLGITRALTAVRAIEAGEIRPALFDDVGDDWDIEARAQADLTRLGLGSVGLDRRVGTLSGGETMLVSLAGLRLARTPIVLLDEPTNNLDRVARERLYETITQWSGTLVIVSHDVELLDLMDETVELYNRGLDVYGGGYSHYRDVLEAEQRAAAQALRSAEQDVRREQRERREAETKLARRARYAKSDFANKRKPKIIMNTRKSQAEVSAGKLRDRLDDRVEGAQAAVEAEQARVRDDDHVRIELPELVVPHSRRLLELHHAGGVHIMAGPERIALTGRNGVGKTRLIETIFDETLRAQQDVFIRPLTEAIGYLPQRLDGLDEDESAIENVRSDAPTTLPGTIRGLLARFLIRGDDAHRPVSTLSGGERFRVMLARLLLADPPHQLLVLDEPTNNLDLSTRQALIDSLRAHRGALVIVTHDHDLLRAAGLDVVLDLDDRGALVRREVPHPAPGIA